MSVSLHEYRPRHRVRAAVRIGLAVSHGVLGLAGIAGVTAKPASAGPPSISGYATNVDVPDGTDKECEGFEVDIEDITPADVTYTWPGAQMDCRARADQPG